MEDKDLISHWQKFGSKESRYSSLLSCLNKKGLSIEAFNDLDIEYEFYIAYYPDLIKAGINNRLQAKIHYLEYGKKEGRLNSFTAWLKKNKIYEGEIPPEFNFKEIIELNRRKNIDLKMQDFLNTIAGNANFLFHFKDDFNDNLAVYISLFDFYFRKKNYDKAINIMNCCLMMDDRPEYLELLGNCFLEKKDYVSALSFFTMVDQTKSSKSLLYNISVCQKELQQPTKALESLVRAIVTYPEVTFQKEKLDEYVNSYWISQLGIHHSLAVRNARVELIEQVHSASQIVYNAYLKLFGVNENPTKILNCNFNRVLIVGDFIIPQCVRYRIKQKLEQFEFCNTSAEAISWTDIHKNKNLFAFYDIVIFYRVPAVPEVLKMMASVNASGRLSYYEIDDLLFDPDYPPALNSYGGSINIDVYIELIKGMALFNAAARYCRAGIASTKPLAEALKSLVFSGECFVHRNGLDSENEFTEVSKDHKKTIDIFYGSGTLAHNEDFVNLALPALRQVLDKHKNTRLIIAGHLNLPVNFCLEYKKQLIIIPHIKNIKAYWSLLQNADINIAVLSDDKICGCKSELKWFEAACFKVPSVVSSTKNYRDVIHHKEDAFLASSSEEWCEALGALISDARLRKKIGANALERVRHEYSLEYLGENIRDIFKLTIAQSGPNGKKKRKKKIAIVNVFFPPQSLGGATRVVSDNFDSLVRNYSNYFDLCVFTSEADFCDPHQMSVYCYKGVKVYKSTILSQENMEWFPRDPEIYRLFSDFLALEKPNLIHFHCIQRLTGSIVEAARDMGIPYIVTVHDAWWISDHQFLVDIDGRIFPDGHPDIYEPRGRLPNNISLSASVDRLFYLKRLLLDAQQVLTVSQSFAEIYEKNGIRPILVNKNGISESVNWKPKKTKYSEKLICAHIGGMSLHKGYFLLKRVISTVQPKNIEMLVVDHSKDENYVQKTSWGGVPVKFVGRVRQNSVVDLYQKIDVLFAPSLWPESYGLVTREAIACGCWVVASNLGGIGEDIVEGNNGWVVTPDQISVGKIIHKLDVSYLKYKQLSNTKAIRLVDEQVKELINIYKFGDKID
ncbi:MAG: glycosyltransferase [Desulfuromusa sp.]|nr:glycosyltransferase [Desulfuromusa sp.]